MKTKLNTLFFLLVACFFLSNNAKAQLKLIHYWDFNSTTPAGGGGGTMLSSLSADWSDIGNAKLVYDNSATTSSSCDCTVRDSIMDNGTQGTGINARPVLGNDTAGLSANNLFVRLRNPSHNMRFLWYIPTTGFKNILLTYATETSSATSGQKYQLYSYSLDSGATFQTTALPIDTTAMSALTSFTKVQLDLSAITGANNNPKFVFCITFGDKYENDTIAKGNNRFDNITVEGDSMITTSVNEIKENFGGYSIYPNPSSSTISLTGNYYGEKSISIYNVVGQKISDTETDAKQSMLNVSQFTAGVYFINIKEIAKGTNYTLKFVKN